MAQRPFEIGSEAARLLLRRIHRDSDAIEQLLLPTQLIKRGSSIKPNQLKLQSLAQEGGPIE
jgi:DNA-binding LacI/PurR family transcriptional regulator